MHVQLLQDIPVPCPVEILSLHSSPFTAQPRELLGGRGTRSSLTLGSLNKTQRGCVGEVVAIHPGHLDLLAANSLEEVLSLGSKTR